MTDSSDLLQNESAQPFAVQHGSASKFLKRWAIHFWQEWSQGLVLPGDNLFAVGRFRQKWDIGSLLNFPGITLTTLILLSLIHI